MASDTVDGHADTAKIIEVDTTDNGTKPLATQPTKRGFRFWAIIAGLAIATFQASLENSVIVTSGPTIVQDLQMGEEYIWITNAFFLGCAASQPLFGQLCNVFGRRWLMLSATAIFTIGSGVCGGATNSAMLIAGRAVQGVGSGGITSIVNIIIADLVPLRDRGYFIAIIMVLYAVGLSGGPIVGGVLVDRSTWRWVRDSSIRFYREKRPRLIIELPIGILHQSSHWWCGSPAPLLLPTRQLQKGDDTGAEDAPNRLDWKRPLDSRYRLHAIRPKLRRRPISLEFMAHSRPSPIRRAGHHPLCFLGELGLRVRPSDATASIPPSHLAHHGYQHLSSLDVGILGSVLPSPILRGREAVLREPHRCLSTPDDPDLNTRNRHREYRSCKMGQIQGSTYCRGGRIHTGLGPICATVGR
ncbi:hypothetical protein O1611_g7687 [Lasiodiplodia mahajangana]|uniref:Uncharacterized protein n=1 Tax=Lasiodiplodia mahajangana TaxID=1108764 RepID=A0ACC2JEU1_9PEZI|nr:hypothetical protein O1611_g7687 [Lasiodiplodia mahajangana]